MKPVAPSRFTFPPSPFRQGGPAAAGGRESGAAESRAQDPCGDRMTEIMDLSPFDVTRCPHGESSHPAAGRSYDRFSTCRPKGPPARRTIGFQPVGPRAHRPVDSQSLDSPPQTTPHQVSAHRAVGRTCPFDNPKNWPHQSTAAGPLLLIDSPLSLLSPLGLRPPHPATKNPRPRPSATKRVLTANQA